MLSSFGLEERMRNGQIALRHTHDMRRGSIQISSLAGGFDLYHTLESGQSYLWRRLDGEMYSGTPSGQGHWYETVADGTYLRVRQLDGRLEWMGQNGSEAIVRRLLRLDDDLSKVYEELPSEPVIEAAVDQYHGMRLVRDPVFPCLISFICSAQMRVERIYAMQNALAKAYGERVEVDGQTVRAFPRPAQLARATESDLRDLGIGYRAPYVCETARMVADGNDPMAAKDLSYEDAREFLTQYPGVGNKVADCVLLFSLGYLEAVPLDTWIRSAIADCFPDCACGNYAETSRAIRDRFGGDVAGYAQTYVFHYLRNGGRSPGDA